MGGQHETQDDAQHRNEAISLLWDAHAAELRAYIAKRGVSHGDVDDVLADTFMAVMQLAPDKLRELKPGWLFTVALRRLIDRSRSDTVRRRHLEAMGQSSFHESFDTGLALRLDLEAALDVLSAHQRRAIELRYFEGRAITDVSERMQLSYSATESLLARARRTLTAR